MCRNCGAGEDAGRNGRNLVLCDQSEMTTYCSNLDKICYPFCSVVNILQKNKNEGLFQDLSVWTDLLR